ncbi:MAG: PAS domain S-box protein, partial [Anaerolineales bacterium]
MDETLRVLLLEDVVSDADPALRELRQAGLAVTSLRVETEADFARALAEFAPDLILADYSLPQFDGLSAIQLAQSRRPDLPIIMLSGSLGEERAIESLKLGATDYVLKQRLERLGPVAKRALHEAAERRQQRSAEAQIEFQANLLAHINDAVIALDDRFRITAWNRAAETLYGWTAAEVLGAGSAEILRSDLTPAAWAEVIRLKQERQTYRMEAVHYHKSGRPLQVEAEVIPLNEPRGQIGGYVMVNRDISERKRAADHLRYSEERLNAIFEQSPLSIQVFSADGVFVRANRAWEHLWGGHRDQLAGVNILTDNLGLEAQGIKPYVLKAFAGEAAAVPPTYFDPEAIGQAGVARWTKAWMYPIKDA